MEISKIVQNFESQDAHAILDGVWTVLDCTDVELLRQLLPYVKEWKERIRKVDLGGAFYRNSSHFNTAIAYIEDMCNGDCHCSIYSSTSLFAPILHKKKQFISILNTAVNVEKYEIYFDAQCTFCGKMFKVTEFIGGHVPWYQWHVA